MLKDDMEASVLLRLELMEMFWFDAECMQVSWWHLTAHVHCVHVPDCSSESNRSSVAATVESSENRARQINCNVRLENIGSDAERTHATLLCGADVSLHR